MPTSQAVHQWERHESSLYLRERPCLQRPGVPQVRPLNFDDVACHLRSKEQCVVPRSVVYPKRVMDFGQRLWLVTVRG